LHDGETPAEAAFAARRFGLPLSVAVSQRGADIKMRFIGENGGAVTREAERRLLSPCPEEVPAERFGAVFRETGIKALYVSHIASIASETRGADAEPLRLYIRGAGASARALRDALTLAGGYELSASPRGVLSFETSPDGETCSARGPGGAEYDHGHLLTAAAALHFELGRGSLVLPPSAPEAIDTLAERFGGKLRRSDRDAVEWSRDGLSLAAELGAHMRRRGATIDALINQAPRFALAELEIQLTTARGAVMRRLSESVEAGDMLDSGLLLRRGEGLAVITPRRRKNALCIRAEAPSAEIAGLLCAELARRARAADCGF
jgi:hypothetical protein